MRFLVLVRPARPWWMAPVWWMIWWMAKGTTTSSGTASGALVVRDQGGGPVVYVKFRHEGRQRERRVGRGWLVPAGDAEAKPKGKALGEWRERRGRPAEGFLTPDGAREQAREVVARFAEELEADQRHREERARERVGLAAACEAWIAWGTRDDYDSDHEAWKHSTARNNARSARRVLRELGDVPLDRIDEARLRRFLRDLRPMRGGRVLAAEPSRVMRATYVLALRGIFATAVREGWIETSPAAALKVGRSKRRKQAILRREDYLEPDEVRRVVAQARAAQGRRSAGGVLLCEQDAVLLLTAALTGLRLGEVRALTWQQVDFANASIRVVEGYTQGHTDTPKSGSGRTVPLAHEVAQALARLALRPHLTAPSDLVFVGQNGGHVEEHGLRERFYAAQEAAGIAPRRTMHKLRHTFAVTCARHGIPIATIQSWLGHEDISTTMIYAAFVPNHEDAAKVSAAFAATSADAPPLDAFAA